jgi:hypothetical protein
MYYRRELRPGLLQARNPNLERGGQRIQPNPLLAFCKPAIPSNPPSRTSTSGARPHTSSAGQHADALTANPDPPTTARFIALALERIPPPTDLSCCPHPPAHRPSTDAPPRPTRAYADADPPASHRALPSSRVPSARGPAPSARSLVPSARGPAPSARGLVPSARGGRAATDSAAGGGAEPSAAARAEATLNAVRDEIGAVLALVAQAPPPAPRRRKEEERASSPSFPPPPPLIPRRRSQPTAPSSISRSAPGGRETTRAPRLAARSSATQRQVAPHVLATK